jgi:A/G-specific adenine glycosylase
MNAQSQRQLDARLRARFQRRLLNWYEKNKRDLPWRRTHDAYRIWVAEIMLQQTTVATVIPYYERFLARFPTLRDLADAPRDDVLRWWAGLGYYARARNLHKAAQEVVKRYDGSIPQNPQELGSLPGVGRYTVGAILSIAFNQEVPLLDGNVTRVLCRVFHVTGDPARSPALRRLWSLAEELIPKGKAREFNQAMMELGALVCTPTPRCEVCPVGGLCEAKQLNKQTQLPAPIRKRTIKEVEDVAALIRWEGDASAKPSGWEGDAPAKPSGSAGASPSRYLIVQRPLNGLWGGLWEFPRGTIQNSETPAAALRRTLRELLGVKVKVGSLIATFQQRVEHRRLTLRCFACALTDGRPRALGCEDWKWATLEEILRQPLSTAQRRVVEALTREAEQWRSKWPC